MGRIIGVVILVLVLLWVAIPVGRAVLLLQTNPLRSAPSIPRNLPVQAVTFAASDKVRLAGWLVPTERQEPTVILVPGFKANRESMLPYARFLHAARYNVLLYDSRGTGSSGGSFGLGLSEVRDVEGAVRFLERRPDLPSHRYALLGVSLGAGAAIVAAAHLPAVLATVADSPYADQRYTVDRLDTLRLGPLHIPLAPLAPWTVDRLLGAPLDSFNPLRSIRRIPPRGVLLIHSRDDTNPTTPLSAAQALLRAGQPSTTLWIAPRGGHAGALAANPAAYTRHVLAFLRRYFAVAHG